MSFLPGKCLEQAEPLLDRSSDSDAFFEGKRGDAKKTRTKEKTRKGTTTAATTKKAGQHKFTSMAEKVRTKGSPNGEAGRLSVDALLPSAISMDQSTRPTPAVAAASEDHRVFVKISSSAFISGDGSGAPLPFIPVKNSGVTATAACYGSTVPTAAGRTGPLAVSPFSRADDGALSGPTVNAPTTASPVVITVIGSASATTSSHVPATVEATEGDWVCHSERLQTDMSLNLARPGSNPASARAMITQSPEHNDNDLLSHRAYALVSLSKQQLATPEPSMNAADPASDVSPSQTPTPSTGDEKDTLMHPANGVYDATGCNPSTTTELPPQAVSPRGAIIVLPSAPVLSGGTRGCSEVSLEPIEKLSHAPIPLGLEASVSDTNKSLNRRIFLKDASFLVTEEVNSANNLKRDYIQAHQLKQRPVRRSIHLPVCTDRVSQPQVRRLSAASLNDAGLTTTNIPEVIHNATRPEVVRIDGAPHGIGLSSGLPVPITHSVFNEPQDIATTRNYRKWRSMRARNLQHFYRDHKQTFLRRMRRGIPQRFRWEAWKQAAELPSIVEATDLSPIIPLVPIRVDTDTEVRIGPGFGRSSSATHPGPGHHRGGNSAESSSSVGGLREGDSTAGGQRMSGSDTSHDENEFSVENLIRIKDKMTPIELYERLKGKASKFASLIDIDIPRTFPEVALFDKRAQESLRNVLNAYANFAPHVGYCQGMNFVMGFIQLVSDFGDEAEIFWFFSIMMSRYNMHGFFREKFPLLTAFVTTFDHLAEYYAPELRKHFQEEQVLPPVYLHPWYLTVFVTSLPLGTVVVLWDFIIYMGLHALLPVTLALLKVLQSFLLRLRFEGIVKFLKSLRSSGDCDESKIGKMLVKQAEHYPVLDRYRPMVVDVDFRQLLCSVGAWGARRPTERLVDFDTLQQPAGDNPLNAALANQADLLDDDDDEENGAATSEVPTPAGEARSTSRPRIGEMPRAQDGGGRIMGVTGGGAGPRRTSLPVPRSSPAASENSSHRPARSLRFLPKMIGRSSKGG